MGILTEIWSLLSGGYDVKELKSLPNYPDQPERQIKVEKFEFNETLHQASGVRSRTYFKCIVSGPHTFSVKCDDQCRFTVKEDENFYETLGYQDAIYSQNYQE